MAQRGSFVRMLGKMIQLMGGDKAARYAILSSLSHNDYVLVTVEDACKLARLDVDGDLRTVIAPTYNELNQILKGTQGDMFGKVADGDHSKSI